MHETFRALLEGNDDHADRYEDRFDHLQLGQSPDAVTVCCSDSRVLQDQLWGNEDPGRVFTVGNIGNRVVQRTEDGEDVVSGDVCYPLAYTGTETAVVVGHSGCGAVTATYDAIENDDRDDPPGVRRCIDLLRPRLEPGVEALPDDLEDAAAVNRLVEYNVDQQVAMLLESEDVPAAVSVYGVVYDFQNVYDRRRGEVHVVNVDGVTDPDALRDEHPAFADRIRRLWAP